LNSVPQHVPVSDRATRITPFPVVSTATEMVSGPPETSPSVTNVCVGSSPASDATMSALDVPKVWSLP